jgi:BlaI family transcriptional regulator, penicillinase repressor
MAPSAENQLTPLELKIMQVIWAHGPGTVAEIQAQLHPPLAYTTVQTMLNILARKKKLRRELEGRAFVYLPAVTEDRALGQALRDLIDRMFAGSSEDLVVSLVKSRQLDPARLAEISKRLEAEADAAGDNEKGVVKP